MFVRSENKIYLAAIVVFLFVVGAVLAYLNLPKVTSNLINFKTVQIGGATLRAEIAITPQQLMQGLSGKKRLNADSGMLFVFSSVSESGIWMKDMNFPIDVLWITEDYKVSDIVENMLPASYPRVYASSVPVRYVLEVPAGTVKKSGIKVGQVAIIK